MLNGKCHRFASFSPAAVDVLKLRKHLNDLKKKKKARNNSLALSRELLMSRRGGGADRGRAAETSRLAEHLSS